MNVKTARRLGDKFKIQCWVKTTQPIQTTSYLI